MITNKKTKIVATIGPVTENEKTLTELVESGMNVMRLNFSHGSHEEHEKRIDLARLVSKKLKTPIAVLQDLSGPKIRTGDLETEEITLENGSEIELTTKEILGSPKKLYINYPNLTKEVEKGHKIFLNDGKQELLVKKVSKDSLICKIIQGGTIKSRRGVNFPDSKLSISSLTEKDKKDAKFGIKKSVDFMAVSFVRRSSDVLELREILEKAKADIQIISKIETKEAIENIDDIISVSDGIMVARGDLAVEIPAEEVPIYQKEIIKKCNALGKPVITATQILASMTSSPVPTRAEISDIANAILDGTDAIMLSEETTIGSHPEKAVEIMLRVSKHTEKHLPYEEILEKSHLAFKDTAASISYAVVNTAHELKAKMIVALSVSGTTAKMIARHRPARPILVITPNEKTYNRCALSFNCYPVLAKELEGVTSAIETSKDLAKKTNLLKNEDKIIISAGIPFNKPGNTNLLLVQKID